MDKDIVIEKVLYCPHCGAAMESHDQHYDMLNKTVTMATCWQSACKFYRYTVSEASLLNLAQLQDKYASVGLVVKYDPTTGELINEQG